MWGTFAKRFVQQAPRMVQPKQAFFTPIQATWAKM